MTTVLAHADALDQQCLEYSEAVRELLEQLSTQVGWHGSPQGAGELWRGPAELIAGGGQSAEAVACGQQLPVCLFKVFPPWRLEAWERAAGAGEGGRGAGALA